ncbi:hypothetical protein CBR_g34004 [Chara braunii]|uniref:Uncharacterized protein n=1 Tax=Chara braunii TaxID=69332 RepID=A0A388LHV4_CHABU|nr:hypothetical protein CBR_g34004 [Chara braunii]|eukprot:GBG81823.1 hypothetical protein CBR_g34004 [Chara braunii]
MASRRGSSSSSSDSMHNLMTVMATVGCFMLISELITLSSPTVRLVYLARAQSTGGGAEGGGSDHGSNAAIAVAGGAGNAQPADGNGDGGSNTNTALNKPSDSAAGPWLKGSSSEVSSSSSEVSGSGAQSDGGDVGGAVAVPDVAKGVNDAASATAGSEIAGGAQPAGPGKSSASAADAQSVIGRTSSTSTAENSESVSGNSPTLTEGELSVGDKPGSTQEDGSRLGTSDGAVLGKGIGSGQETVQQLSGNDHSGKKAGTSLTPGVVTEMVQPSGNDRDGKKADTVASPVVREKVVAPSQPEDEPASQPTRQVVSPSESDVLEVAGTSLTSRSQQQLSPKPRHEVSAPSAAPPSSPGLKPKLSNATTTSNATSPRNSTKLPPAAAPAHASTPLISPSPQLFSAPPTPNRGVSAAQVYRTIVLVFGFLIAQLPLLIDGTVVS